MARIARLTPAFRRALRILGVVQGSARRRALAATIASLSNADVLPGPADMLTDFHPGRAHVRRVAEENLWVLYRFDAAHLDVLTVRNSPPVPSDEVV